jgi:LysM repeat protein
MKRLTFRRWLLPTLVFFPLGWTLSTIFDVSNVVAQAQEQVQEEFLSYPLRSGEALSDVARLFRVPVEELIQINHVTDPSRLQVGQVLKVPNAFARQVSQLQKERDQLTGEKEQLQRATKTNQTTLAQLQAEIRRLEEENSSLSAHLAATAWWRRGAFLFAGMLVVALCWGLSLRRNQGSFAKHLATLTEENTALAAAKEKYRQAAAQVELRYQKLYRAEKEVPEKFIQDGITLLERAFNEGSARLEQILMSIRTEHEKTQQTFQAGPHESAFHSLRHLFHRDRLKYHEA